MILSIMLFLLICPIALRYLKYYKVSYLFYTCFFIFFFAIGCGPIPSFLLNKLQSYYRIQPKDEWRDHNKIIVLGAGTTVVKNLSTINLEPSIFAYGRIVEAEKLYKSCKNLKSDCKIIIIGGDPQKNGFSESMIYRNTLVEMGLNPDDIKIEEKSLNTFQNAQFVSNILQEDRSDLIILVSSAVHLKRSQLYFKHFGIHATAMHGDFLNVVMTPIPISYNFTLTDIAIHEYLDIARYYVYNFLKLNPPKVIYQRL
ncbi:hypothetical protein B488_05710 [Liberibacter crescens BT-1]|uniref:DUF218 domain-containing protein n=1 Tax=Liberibacter crescens (strain BT-1) TaxID=1215343 RepID=L0EV95_LIBCB|nr:YdcF family protein [Liberibacter crescens]AGA64563.1 hypothetical protein B488_05710 [Liberibacter crescens BT-1]AMC12706.1 hypothetical protein RL73_02975 [Liberibacter crescens]